MPEEATTLDLVELVRRAFEAASRRDLDAVICFFASDTVFEGRDGWNNLRGRAAFRSFVEDWFGAYGELEFKLVDVRNLGNGVVFAVVVQEGSPAGSAGHGHPRQRPRATCLSLRACSPAIQRLYGECFGA